jgi:two-component system sensor histidine kinase YesM
MRFVPFKHINLRKKLIIIVVLFILSPVATAGIFFYLSSEKYVTERTNEETQQIIMLLQKNVDQLLKGYEGQLMTIYQHEEIISRLGVETVYDTQTSDMESEESVNRFLRDFLRGKDELESIYLFSENRENIYFSDSKGSALFLDQVKLHPEWVNTLSTSRGKTKWISTYELPPNHYISRSTHYFIMGMQIKNIFSVLEPLGTIIVNIKIDVLNKLMADVQVSPNGFLLLVDPKGNVIWHRNPEALGNTNVRDIPFFQKIDSGDQSFMTQKLNGETYHISYGQSGYNNWYYISFVPQSDLEAEIANIKQFLAVTFIVSVVIFSLLAIMTTVYITRPLRRIVMAMNRLDKDNLGVKVNAQSKDEIGVLQEAFNSMGSKIRNLIEEVRMVTAKEKEAELKALQAQINPHFVYNSLDTINWMAIEKQEKGISGMITALSDIMRYAIRPGSNLAPIQEEIKWVENYAYIQKNRFESRFDIHVEVDPRALQYKIPRLLLQPFIENAILHGMEDKEESGVIQIRIQLEGASNRLVLEVEDNGSGISEEQLQHIYERRNTGIGIHNINDRLKLEYGAGYGVTVHSVLGEGTKVTIIVPCIN